MMRAAKHCWEASGYRVLGMAVSGIAAKGLESSAGISSSTIYSIKMQLAFGKLEIGPNDILVMDEAGMTDLHDFALIVDTVRTAGAKLVIIGDPVQLQPVGIGAPFRAITERVGFTELNHIQRQTSPGDCVASQLLAQGAIKQALDYYNTQQRIHYNLAHEHERVFEKVKTTSGLAKTPKEIKIDWVSDEFNDEFNALRKSKDSDHQYLVKFRDKLKNISNQAYEKILTKQLNSLAMNIGTLKSKREAFKKLAPNLFLRLEAFLKFKSRQKDFGRDFD